MLANRLPFKGVTMLGNSKVGLIEFKWNHHMCSTMMRFQEYYESPKFKGKVFTHEEFQDWYANAQGRFSYYEDWSGFNLPRKCIEEVFVSFPDLWKKERLLVKSVLDSDAEYIIACIDGDMGAMVHEISHGLYYTNQNYRKEMDSISEKMPQAIKKKIFRELAVAGYHEDVFMDELQAYMVDGINNTYDFNFTDRQQKTVDKWIPRFQEVLKYVDLDLLTEWKGLV
jgi:hypothetical protein